LKTVMILGDSLSLPRPKDIRNFNPYIDRNLGVEFSETYPYLLQVSLDNYYVVNRAVRASTIKIIYNRDLHDHIILTKPNVLVIHVGLVDMWPRKELNGESFLSQVEFTYYYVSLLKEVLKYSDIQIICIGIHCASEVMQDKFKKLNRNRFSYNEIIKAISKRLNLTFIDIGQFVTTENASQYLLDDGQHFNPMGNRLLAEKLHEAIKISERFNVYESSKKKLNYSSIKLDLSYFFDLHQVNDQDLVIIYGAGQLGKRIYEKLVDRKIRVVLFVDKNQKGSINNIPIINPGEFFEQMDKIEANKIIIASYVYKQEILDELMHNRVSIKIITHANNIDSSKIYELIEVDNNE